MAGQTIKTYYKTPVDKEKEKREALQGHSDRRQINREIRDKEIGHDYSKGGTYPERKPFHEREDAPAYGRGEKRPKKSSAPKKPTAPAPSRTEKAKGWLKDRATAIAHETQDLRPRRGTPSPMSTFGMGMPGSSDMFGVGNFGGGRGLQGMMGADPFNEMSPRRPPRPTPAPQRKKKRKTQHREPSGGGPNMFGIPKSMKWMF